jgi:hypothetical protein
MAARSIPLRQLRGECEFFSRSIEALSGGVLPDAVAEAQPGEPGNPAKGADGWLVYYRTLVAAHARLTHRGGTDSAPGDRAGLAILAERPITKQSMTVNSDGTPRTFTVYPKSFEALRQMAMIEAELTKLLPWQRAAMEEPEVEPSLAGRIVGAILDSHRLLAWIATHPGPGIPWEDGQSPPDVLPTSVMAWTSIELHEIRVLHEEVNHHQLLAARRLLETESPTGEGTPSWSRFFVGAAELLGTTERVLLRDRSLLSVLFHVQMRLDERRKAEAERQTAEPT